MVRTTKVFLIIGMILTFYLIFPLILGLIALSKINNSESVDEIRSWGIITLLFVNIVAGILMLNIREEDLELERKRTGYIREENYYIDFEDEEILVSERITPEQYIEGIIGLTKSLDKVLDNDNKETVVEPLIVSEEVEKIVEVELTPKEVKLKNKKNNKGVGVRW